MVEESIFFWNVIQQMCYMCRFCSSASQMAFDERCNEEEEIGVEGGFK
jgi:hypothetical protein